MVKQNRFTSFTDKKTTRQEPMITEFKCQIPPSAVDDLKRRISQTRWTDEIEGSAWSFGADLSYIKELADYWAAAEHRN